MSITVTQALPYEVELDRWTRTEYRIVADAGEDEAAVIAQAEADIPATLNSMGNRNITLVYQHAQGLLTRWRARVQWSASSVSQTPVGRDTGDNVYQFDLSPETVHITRSLAVISSTAGAEDYKGAIGVSREGGNTRVLGVDIQAATFKWSETHYLANATVTDSYIKSVAGLRLGTNSAAFKVRKGGTTTYDIGTVLFLGASGSQRADDWAITFHFAYSPAASITIGVYGLGDVVIAKGGWEYLDAVYDDVPGATALIQQPIAVYVHKVFDSVDFSTLGIR